MTITFNPPAPLPAGTPKHIGARCEVLHNSTVIGYFERHDFGPGKMPSSGKVMLDLEDIPPSSCYAFRDLRGMTQFASRDRDAMIKRIGRWAGQ
jgi:hypothetical protein